MRTLLVLSIVYADRIGQLYHEPDNDLYKSKSAYTFCSYMSHLNK
jgi:hypothetical protein